MDLGNGIRVTFARRVDWGGWEDRAYISPGERREIRRRCRRADRKWSRPVSRVLSRTIIHLGRPSPNASCDLPEDTCGPQAARGTSSYLVLLRRGFTLPPSLPKARCALTAPFHPYLPPKPVRRHRRYTFCGTFRRFASPRRYLASCPVEPGLSSAAAWRPRSSGRLRAPP